MSTRLRRRFTVAPGGELRVATHTGRTDGRAGLCSDAIAVDISPLPAARHLAAEVDGWAIVDGAVSDAQDSAPVSLRLPCTHDPLAAAATRVIFSSTGAEVMLEGPSDALHRALALAPCAPVVAASEAAAATASVTSLERVFPFRRALLQLHELLRRRRAAGEQPRVMVVGRPGSGTSTMCRTLCNWAARDGTPVMLLCADVGGADSQSAPVLGQPGCVAVAAVDLGLDPADSALLVPTAQTLLLPHGTTDRRTRDEPLRYALDAAALALDMRAHERGSDPHGGVVVELMGVDDLDAEGTGRIIEAAVDTCDVDLVIFLSADRLRQSMRVRLAAPGFDVSEQQDGALALCAVRPGLSLAGCTGLPSRSARPTLMRLGSVRARWLSYFFGSATSQLAPARVRVPAASAEGGGPVQWVQLRAQTSTAMSGMLALQGDGTEEQRRAFAVTASAIDPAMEYATRCAVRAKVGGAPPLVVAARVDAARGATADELAQAEVLGFVLVLGVDAATGCIDILAPCALDLDTGSSTFVLLDATYCA